MCLKIGIYRAYGTSYVETLRVQVRQSLTNNYSHSQITHKNVIRSMYDASKFLAPALNIQFSNLS